MLDLLPDAVLILGPSASTGELVILECNDVACHWGGYTRSELLGQPLSFCCGPDQDVAPPITLDRLQHGQVISATIAYRRNDGSTRAAEFTYALKTIAGRPVVVATGHDLSAQHLAYQSVYENAQRLHLALYGANAGMWEWNMQTGRVIWSDENYRVLGLEPGSCPSTYENWLNAVHPDDREVAQATVERAVAEQSDLYLESRVIWPDGTIHWLADIGKILYDAAGNPERMIGLLVDISPQKAAEQEIRSLNASLEARVRERTDELAAANQSLSTAYTQLEQLLGDLRVSRDLLRTIVDGLEDGLALLDNHGTVLLANQALAAFYGLTPTAVYERPWRSVCALTLPLIDQTLGDGRPARARLRFAGPSGAALVVDARTFPTGDSTPPRQVVLHLADVSERVQLEQLAVSNERLATSGRLAATIAHEVNTPLQIIQNLLYLAESDPAERDGHMRLVSDELSRITVLVRRLLDLHRSGDTAGTVLDVNDLIERTLTLLAGTLARHRVEVVRHLAPNLPAFWGRQDHVLQVLLNLMLNAVEVMPRGGTLALGTSLGPAPLPRPQQPAAPGGARDTGPVQLAPRDARPTLVITVADTGPGIRPDLHEQIFDMFFTTKREGSGLGLAISRQLVEGYGGQLFVQSGLGTGATFFVVLPCLDAESQSAA